MAPRSARRRASSLSRTVRCCSAHLTSCGTYASGCIASRRAFTAPPGIARGQSPRLCAPDTTGGGVVTRRTTRVPSCAVVRASTRGRRRKAVGVVPRLRSVATVGWGVATRLTPLMRLSPRGEGARPARFRVPLFGPRRRDGDGRRWGLFHICAFVTYHTHRGR